MLMKFGDTAYVNHTDVRKLMATLHENGSCTVKLVLRVTPPELLYEDFETFSEAILFMGDFAERVNNVVKVQHV